MGEGNVAEEKEEEEEEFKSFSRLPAYLVLCRPSSAPQALPPPPSLPLLLIAIGADHPSLTPSLPPSFRGGGGGGGGGASKGAGAVRSVASASRATADKAVRFFKETSTGSDLGREGGSEGGKDGVKTERVRNGLAPPFPSTMLPDTKPPSGCL